MKKSTELAKRDATLPERANGVTRTDSPLVDVYENADELLLVADMPVVVADDLAIHVDKDELTIENPPKPSQEANASPTSFVARAYRRSFTIPHGLDIDKVKAEFSNGVLSLHLPKLPAIKPRQIPVRAG